MTLQWYVIRLRPTGRLPAGKQGEDTRGGRLEFDVLHALNQRERPALVPFETKWIKRPNKKFVIERRYPLYPCYIFAGFPSFADLMAERAAINEHAKSIGKMAPILGAVGYGARPAKLTTEELSEMQSRSGTGPTEINLHRAIQPGGRAEIIRGRFAGHSVVVDSVTKKKAMVLLNLFNSMHVVEIDPASLVAA
jgi:transcription antitermination factor NusG